MTILFLRTSYSDLHEEEAHLFETVSILLASSFHSKLSAEDVAEFSTVAIPST